MMVKKYKHFWCCSKCNNLFVTKSAAEHHEAVCARPEPLEKKCERLEGERDAAITLMDKARCMIYDVFEWKNDVITHSFMESVEYVIELLEAHREDRSAAIARAEKAEAREERWKRAIKTLLEYQFTAMKDENIEYEDWVYNPHAENSKIYLDRAFASASSGDLDSLEKRLGIKD